MSQSLAPTAAPPVQSHRPLTFQERGLYVPFISPMLTGTRLRPASRGGMELVVPNPSGRRGVYIAPWDDIQDLGRPTVHDTVLYRRLGQVAALTPASVRATAWAVAAEGLAGADARQAAAAAASADRAELVLANFLLMLTLTEEMEPTGLIITANTERTPALEERVRLRLDRLAQDLGRDRAGFLAELETLGEVFAPAGVERPASTARYPALIARLRTVASEIRSWGGRYGEAANAGTASRVADAMAHAASAAGAVLASLHRELDDMRGLIRRWLHRPDDIITHGGRLDWVLDGWEWVCLLWEHPGSATERDAILREIARQVPVLPRQIADWTGDDPDRDDPEPISRGFSRPDAAASLFSLIARNEYLRGLCR